MRFVPIKTRTFPQLQALLVFVLRLETQLAVFIVSVALTETLQEIAPLNRSFFAEVQKAAPCCQSKVVIARQVFQRKLLGTKKFCDRACHWVRHKNYMELN